MLKHCWFVYGCVWRRIARLYKLIVILNTLLVSLKVFCTWVHFWKHHNVWEINGNTNLVIKSWFSFHFHMFMSKVRAEAVHIYLFSVFISVGLPFDKKYYCCCFCQHNSSLFSKSCTRRCQRRIYVRGPWSGAPSSWLGWDPTRCSRTHQ